MENSDLKNKIESIHWFRYTQRFSSDFPFIVVNYFLNGHKKYIKIKNLLYINRHSKIYAFRDEAEFKNFYGKIQKFKKRDFLNVAEEVKKLVQKCDSVFKKISFEYLNKLTDEKLSKEFRNFNAFFTRFAAYFIYIQYMGKVFDDDPRLLKYFDKKSMHSIRFNPLIPELNVKLQIFFRVLSGRIGLSYKSLFWLLPEEIEKTTNISIVKLKKISQTRQRFYLMGLLNGKKINSFDKENIKIADNLINLEEKVNSKYLLKGKVAFPGAAKGLVKIILSRKDFAKVSKGDILVTSFVMPYFLPVMKKSAGIIADESGLLSHASIISRELKKPCIIGTKIATKILKDGYLVEFKKDGAIKIINNK